MIRTNPQRDRNTIMTSILLFLAILLRLNQLGNAFHTLQTITVSRSFFSTRSTGCVKIPPCGSSQYTFHRSRRQYYGGDYEDDGEYYGSVEESKSTARRRSSVRRMRNDSLRRDRNAAMRKRATDGKPNERIETTTKNPEESRISRRQRRSSRTRNSVRRESTFRNSFEAVDNRYSTPPERNWSSRKLRQIRREAAGSRKRDQFSRVVGKTSQKLAGMIPNELKDVGSKAARVAARTSREAFDDILVLLEEEEREEEAQRRRRDMAGARKRRRQRVQATVLANTDSPYVTRLDDDDDSLLDSESTGESIGIVKEANENREWIDPPRKESSTRPIQEILIEVNSRGIQYDADTTREELERLLLDDKLKKSNGDKKTVWKATSRVASRAGQKVASKIKKKSKESFRKTKSTVSKLFQSSVDDISSQFEDPIIVDAVVEEIIKTNGEKGSFGNEVGSKRTPKRATAPEDKKRQSIHIDSGQIVQDYYGSENPSKHTLDTPTQGKTRPPEHGDEYQYPPLEPNALETLKLPPANEFTRTRRGGRGRKVPRDRSKRVYSPRRLDREADSLEQLGDYFAESVEAFLWGDESDGDDNLYTSPTKNPRSQQDSAKRSRPKARSGHWKDRMEEQFDVMMGIHDGGKHYSRWLDQEVEDLDTAEGTDAVSYARGKSRRSGGSRRIFERPIWEDQGSILSELFGSADPRQSKNSRLYYSQSFLRSGSLVKLLRTITRSSAVLAGGVCRWASVRGSIPQPLVVVGVVSAVLTSRPRARLRNIVLALLALRTIGELLHGYVYDDDDFWDDHDVEEAEEDCVTN